MYDKVSALMYLQALCHCVHSEPGMGLRREIGEIHLVLPFSCNPLLPLGDQGSK
jgi:hypothetical protein